MGHFSMRSDDQRCYYVASPVKVDTVIISDQKAYRYTDTPTTTTTHHYYQKHPSGVGYNNGTTTYLHHATSAVAQQHVVPTTRGRVCPQTIPRRGAYLQTGNSAPDQLVKVKRDGPIDCNEAAKIYGGIVFTDYGRTYY